MLLFSSLRADFFKRSTLTAALTTGLVAGILDGAAACLQVYLSRGRTPDAVFKFIASGVFGTRAFSGGAMMVVWGIIFHLLIAVVWSMLYHGITLVVRGIAERWIISGVTYGALVWMMMNFVVVPASNTPAITPSVDGLLIIIVCVGIPISFGTRRFHIRRVNGY